MPPQWATTEAARRGARGPNKNYSNDNLLKETELKVALTGSTVGQKAARQRKQRLRKKERRLLYAPILKLQKGVMSGG